MNKRFVVKYLILILISWSIFIAITVNTRPYHYFGTDDCGSYDQTGITFNLRDNEYTGIFAERLTKTWSHWSIGFGTVKTTEYILAFDYGDYKFSYKQTQVFLPGEEVK